MLYITTLGCKNQRFWAKKDPKYGQKRLDFAPEYRL